MATRFTEDTAKKIREQLNLRDLTQRELAQKLEVHEEIVSWALGRSANKTVNVAKLKMIANYFDVVPDFEKYVTKNSKLIKAEKILDMRGTLLELTTDILIDVPASIELKQRAAKVLKQLTA